MKILHILAQKPGNTGSGVYLNSILEQADKKHFRQSVICGISKNEKAELPVSIEKMEAVHFETQDLPFPVVGMSDVMPYPSARYQDLTDSMYEKWKTAFTKAILKLWDEFQPDIIFCHHLWLLTALTRKLLPQAFIVAISHGTGLRQMKLALRFAEIVKAECQKVDVVFASNHYQMETISQVYGIENSRIQLIGNGYNNQIFFQKPKEKNATKTLVYVGKLAFAKGLISLINAINLVNFPLELIIIGSGGGEEAKKIKNLALKGNQKISFTGAISQTEIAAYFHQADAFVLPSFYEGLPLVVIEALACGLPVICTELPGIREWLGESLLQTGIIKLVKLPRLHNMDVPYEEDLPDFEKRLRNSILKQLEKPFEQKALDVIHKYIVMYSWKKIFVRIIQHCKIN
jgi:glycosyltransferase involved in cell wall biosynthesis